MTSLTGFLLSVRDVFMFVQLLVSVLTSKQECCEARSCDDSIKVCLRSAQNPSRRQIRG